MSRTGPRGSRVTCAPGGSVLRGRGWFFRRLEVRRWSWRPARPAQVGPSARPVQVLFFSMKARPSAGEGNLGSIVLGPRGFCAEAVSESRPGGSRRASGKDWLPGVLYSRTSSGRPRGLRATVLGSHGSATASRSPITMILTSFPAGGGNHLGPAVGPRSANPSGSRLWGATARRWPGRM